MSRPVVRRSDLVKVRDTNIAIIKDKTSDSSAIARASRIIIQLYSAEKRLPLPAGEKLPPAAAERGEPQLIDQLKHLRIIG